MLDISSQCPFPLSQGHDTALTDQYTVGISSEALHVTVTIAVPFSV